MDLQLIDRIYESSFVPELWPGVLREIGRIAEAGASLFITNGDVTSWTASPTAHEGTAIFVKEGWFWRGQIVARLFAARHAGFLTDLDVLSPDESLLKALQRALSCVDVPWIPAGNPNTRRLINDIVMTEETDEDGLGGFTSHFELYLDAMGQAGADTRAIDDFIARIRRREDVGHALDCCAAPPGACRFVKTTFNVIRSGELHRIAACFTFGREDIIPEMFRNIVEEIRKSNSARIERFIYYLDRHIEVDTDNHGPMALEMVAAICGDSAIKWREAEETAVSAMRSRGQFWDSVVAMIHQHRFDATG